LEIQSSAGKFLFEKPPQICKLGLAFGELQIEDGAAIFAGKIAASLKKES